jgi:von Willebrand factor type A domain
MNRPRKTASAIAARTTWATVRRRLWGAAARAPALLALVVLTVGVLPAQQAKLLVTVFNEKTGEPLTNLTAANFAVTDDKTPLTVVSATYQTGTLDIMLLVDTSLVGEMVRPLGAAFIAALEEKDQMAIVSYHSSADLIQDFTSSKQSLQSALAEVEYGNNPRVLDALFATLDGGFENSTARRVIILLSAGVEGNSRVPEAEIHRLTRARRVSIYPIFVIGAERGMFQRLADRSGGAFFAARKLKLDPRPLAARVYSVARGQYEVAVSGVYTLGNRVEVTLQGLPNTEGRVRATALVVE